MDDERPSWRELASSPGFLFGVALLLIALGLMCGGCERDGDDDCDKGEPGCICWFDDPDVDGDEQPPDEGDACSGESECLRVSDDGPCTGVDDPTDCRCS